MTDDTRHVGPDVHSETISVAVAEAGRDGEVRSHGRIASTEVAIRKLVKKLGARVMRRCRAAPSPMANPAAAQARYRSRTLRSLCARRKSLSQSP